MSQESRHKLLRILASALAAVDGERQVRGALGRYPRPSPRPAVVAVGKAAAAMAAGACAVLCTDENGVTGPASTAAAAPLSGLVITKQGHCATHRLPGTLRCIEAGHPYPDARSLDAGAALLAYLDSLPADQGVVFLLSGGASALLEVLPAGLRAEDLSRVNHWLLHSGLDIIAINRIRTRLSCLKGGRLARLLAGRPVLQLLLPDVPGDRAAVIGSGPLMAAPEREYGPESASAPGSQPAPVALPDWLTGLLTRAPRPPRPDDPCFNTIQSVCLGGNALACTAAAEAGQALGLRVHRHAAPLCGEAEAVGRRLATALRTAAPGLHVWGGETTVTLPAQPGTGGRNQHLALAAAQCLAGRDDSVLLAVGTDGTDGPTEDAGALVDGMTVARGEAAGLSAAQCLRKADAGRFLARSGDLIHTGPTGTNVMDLVLALKRDA